ncbi:MAG: DNA polymerase III subunit gamma/tau [Candidatus Atribacteria bacterium]|nr:DNA polymerase III subunit gamma/tau [Candidatus Atribacteria bacterium]
MAYLSLYRKWRPSRFEEVVGQEIAVRILTRSLGKKRLHHAYLFCGPRGVGKTTTARLLAMAVNCERGITPQPCEECESCRAIQEGNSLDVVEIDAASHRGIDEIRELRERVKYVPLQSRFKVYIIDEVHMLTPEAFNALLKTLEEPPEHVLFVLATTEPRRLPDTIISRCVKILFNPLSEEAMVEKLQAIAKAEGSKIEEEVFYLIARKAGGSMRDAEGMLEQILAWGEESIDLATASLILREIDKEDFTRLFRFLIEGNKREVLLLLNAWVQRGLSPEDVSHSLESYLRELLLFCITGGQCKEGEGKSKEGWQLLVKETDEENLQKALERVSVLEFELRRSSQPRVLLELCLLDIIKYLAKSGLPEENPVKEEIIQKVEENNGSFWPEILQEVKKAKISLYAFLQAADFKEVNSYHAVLSFNSNCQFHKESIEREENLSILKEILAKKRGGNWKVECVIEEKTPVLEIEKNEDKQEKKEEQFPHNHKPLLSEVINLFSGVLVDYSLTEEIVKGGWEDAELEKSDEGSPEDAG